MKVHYICLRRWIAGQGSDTSLFLNPFPFYLVLTLQNDQIAFGSKEIFLLIPSDKYCLGWNSC